MATTAFGLGFLLIILGGIMEGAFSIPLKVTPKWRWENIWGAGALVALLAVAWPLAFLTVPRIFEVYREASSLSLVLSLLFGAGWGIGGIFFGKGLLALGFSLGLSLIQGLVAIGGSIIPLLMKDPAELLRPAGLVLMGGIVLMIIGLVTCARAGRLKSTPANGSASTDGASKIPFKTGLLYCILAGILSSLVNFGLIFGTGIAGLAVSKGASPSEANNAVWALVFTANFLVNIVYCLSLLKRNRTFSNFSRKATGRYWAWVLFMGLLWPGGIVIYGMGATRIGQMGAYLGFPIMLIVCILTGNVLGLLSGEWKGVAGRPRRIMTAGVAILVLAIVILGLSGKMSS
jgi:L-rhamnose-proton symport protein (RhaT)